MNIYEKIAQYYNDIHGQNAVDEIKKLEMQKIEVKDNVVIISLCRPGLLIWKEAQNIINLAKFIDMEIKIVEVETDEHRILWHLRNIQWAQKIRRMRSHRFRLDDLQGIRNR